MGTYSWLGAISVCFILFNIIFIGLIVKGRIALSHQMKRYALVVLALSTVWQSFRAFGQFYAYGEPLLYPWIFFFDHMCSIVVLFLQVLFDLKVLGIFVHLIEWLTPRLLLGIKIFLSFFFGLSVVFLISQFFVLSLSLNIPWFSMVQQIVTGVFGVCCLDYLLFHDIFLIYYLHKSIAKRLREKQVRKLRVLKGFTIIKMISDNMSIANGFAFYLRDRNPGLSEILLTIGTNVVAIHVYLSIIFNMQMREIQFPSIRKDGKHVEAKQEVKKDTQIARKASMSDKSTVHDSLGDSDTRKL